MALPFSNPCIHKVSAIDDLFILRPRIVGAGLVGWSLVQSEPLAPLRLSPWHLYPHIQAAQMETCSILSRLSWACGTGLSQFHHAGPPLISLRCLPLIPRAGSLARRPSANADHIHAVNQTCQDDIDSNAFFSEASAVPSAVRSWIGICQGRSRPTT